MISEIVFMEKKYDERENKEDHIFYVLDYVKDSSHYGPTNFYQYDKVSWLYTFNYIKYRKYLMILISKKYGHNSIILKIKLPKKI